MAEAMAVEGDGLQGVLSSMVLSSGSGEPDRRGHVLSAEDSAWIDSCLALDPEMPDDSWGPLKNVLLDIISSQATSYDEPATVEVGSEISEGNTDLVLIPEEAEMMLLRGDGGDQLLTNPIYLEENVDPEAEVAVGFIEDTESPENIFRVWDLDTEFEEDELIKQLKNALRESSLRDLLPTLDDSTSPTLGKPDLDDLIAGISDLTLRPSTD